VKLLELKVMLVRERGCLLGVQRDQCHQVRAAVADYDRLRDPPVAQEGVLEVGGRDVLAAGGDDDVLLAAGDRQKAVFVGPPEIAGVQPPINQRLAGRLRVSVVALKDVGTP
jgi:hypothetical protein